MAPDIGRLFEPRGVAVIGASANPEKIGYRLVENILAGGYAGGVYPVNPKGGEILGRPVYRTLRDVPGPVDVALLAIPAEAIPAFLPECAEKKVPYLAIISSGFSEIGHLEQEQQLVAYAREHGMRVLGPNIFGIYSARAGLNATFGPKKVRSGSVAIVTQSGALGIALMGRTAVDRIGVSAVISVGNKADLNEADLLDHLAGDEGTRVILLYMEGVSGGERLVRALRETALKKPVVIIKSGRSRRGAMAAASHTGALAGADDVFDDILRQCGALRAESVGQAFDWCRFLSVSPLPRGDNALIITNGGGIGVMATDACEKYGVHLYDNPAALKEAFSGVMPNFGSAKNPIDLTGQATVSDYGTALDVALSSPDIHAVLALYCETAVFDMEPFPAMIRERWARYRESSKPLFFSLLGGERTVKTLQSLHEDDVPLFTDVYNGVSCLGSLYGHSRFREEFAGEPVTLDLDTARCEAVLARARAADRSFLLVDEGRELMELAGVALPQSRIAHSVPEAVAAAEAIGYPVVMKVVSRDILHKTDAGGIALGLDDREEVMDAYQAILHRCRQYKPGAEIQGVEVAEMVAPGVELIIGARRDRSLGPVVMAGQGGIYVEVMRDIAFRALPITRKEALSMLKQIRLYRLLLGVRGESGRDIEGVIDVILKTGNILLQCESISDIEVNPLVVYEQGKGCRAVDVRVMLSERRNT